MSGTGTVKSAIGSVLPSIRAPRLKRKDLRKYSWLPDVFRVNGSILPRIFGPVLTITLWSIFVFHLSTLGYKLVAVNSIVPLLSVVVGLILVFRNSTSYDRYWEGRKAFATLTTQIRNLARIIWVSVAVPPTDEQPPQIKGKTPTTNLTPAQVRARKIDALRLALSFSYATKHYLRGEDGVNWADYRGVLPKFLTRYDPNYALSASYLATASDPAHPSHDSPDHSMSGRTTPDGSRPDATKRVRVKRSKRQLTDPTQPLLGGFSDGFNDEVSLPFPLIIAHHLSRTVFGFRREGLLETVGPAGMNGIITIVSSMVDQLTTMERIANTPIPRSYSIHLKQCVTLYLFSLPLTLVHDLGWVAVPLVTAVAFTFMGIEGIAEEIEMPFGTDERDLPLDQYCQDLKEEIFFVIEKLPEGGEGIHGYDDGEGDD